MQIFSKLALASTATTTAGTATVAALGYGAMGLTAFYGPSLQDDKAMELLQAVYDAGCRHFDTAEIYATEEKHNESVLGDFFKTVPRQSFTVATKFWPREGDYSYETVKKSLTDSLERLRLDYVDLYYAHRLNNIQGAMEFGRTAKRLVAEGLVKEVGLSEVSANMLKQIHCKVVPIAAIQQEWSLLTRNVEDELVPMCKELDITIVAYSPLARNLLAAKLEETPQDWRASQPRYASENLEQNKQIVNQVHALAGKYKCTAAQLSLAWLLQKANQLGVNLVAIPGSAKIHHAVSNLEAVKIHISDPQDIETLESLAEQIAGARASEGYLEQGFEAHDCGPAQTKIT
jgi:aryl-alcohol dehydrogenase-like predicted oxidoreductase